MWHRTDRNEELCMTTKKKFSMVSRRFFKTAGNITALTAVVQL